MWLMRILREKISALSSTRPGMGVKIQVKGFWSVFGARIYALINISKKVLIKIDRAFQNPEWPRGSNRGRRLIFNARARSRVHGTRLDKGKPASVTG